MLQSKTLSKIENYWLYDFEFRNAIKKFDYQKFSSKFTDIKISSFEFSELIISILGHIRYWPSNSWDYCPNHKIFYDFGWELGLKGTLCKLMDKKDWSNTPKKIDSAWVKEERDKLKDLESKLYLGAFFKGLSGTLTNDYSKEAILANRAGYDFYWSKNKK